MTTIATPTNRYLTDNFAPVTSEVTTFDLPVTGTLPGFLDGRYLRNGPNPVEAPDPATYHWFMGSGMVHGVRLRDGRAEWYRNRWVRSGDVARSLGESRPSGPVHAGLDFSANTHVVGHAGRTFAIAEGGGLPYELSHELDTIGATDLDGTLNGGYTAHPLRDPATGELHAISYYWGWGNKVRYTVVDVLGRVRRTLDIPVGGSPMMHAFSLTERYVVLYDLPVTFDIEQAAATAPAPFVGATRFLAHRVVGRHRVPAAVAGRLTARANNAVFPYKWNPDYPARIGVLARDAESPDVRWLDVAPCYVFHPLNAHDDDGRIVLDVVRHERTFATDPHGPNEGPPTLDRWTVDLVGGKVIEERVSEHGQEFPRVDDRLIGRRHRYGYAVGFETRPADAPATGAAILKHDLLTGRTTTHSFGARHAADEFVFVPAHRDSEEDKGVLMGYVYDEDSGTSDLVVLDAETLELEANVHLPVRVPHGFHGSWDATPPTA